MKTIPNVQHAEHRTELSFDEVVRRFEAAVGSIENGGLEALLQATAASEYRSRVKAQEGPSGFMRFLTVDHGRGLKQEGVDARCRQYTIGNPALAWSMVEHDLGAALFVPLQTAIYEDSATGETVVAYNLPSSLMEVLGNAAAIAAAKSLDEKLIALGVSVTHSAP